jgi:hypothetical protein
LLYGREVKVPVDLMMEAEEAPPAENLDDFN